MSKVDNRSYNLFSLFPIIIKPFAYSNAMIVNNIWRFYSEFFISDTLFVVRKRINRRGLKSIRIASCYKSANS